MTERKKSMGVYEDSHELAQLICEIALDVKATDPELLRVSDAIGLTDYFIIVSGRSDRHTQGIVNRVTEEVKEKAGLKPLSLEGFEQGHWILADYGDVVLHTFYEPTRELYAIDTLWTQPNYTVATSEVA